MSHEDIMYDRSVRPLDHAAKLGNVAEACCVFGISRNTYYDWINRAKTYDVSTLLQ